jgi:hypothetical protein
MGKVLLLTVIIAIFNSPASAQIKKGSILLGGQISYNDANADYTNTQANRKSRVAIFNISAGTALSENKVLGITVTYWDYNNDYVNSGLVNHNVKFNSYNFDVFYRQYKKLVKDFYLFGEMGAGYIGSNETDTNVPGNNVKTRYTTTGAELYLTPGIAYRFYKKLQVELVMPQIAGASYSVRKTTSQPVSVDDNKQGAFIFSTNLNSSFLNNLGLGFKFVL